MNYLELLEDISSSKKYFQFLDYLFSISEENYKRFNSKLIPNYPDIIGIRLPVLKEIAKK